MKKKKKDFNKLKDDLIKSIHKYNFKIPFNSFYELTEQTVNSHSWFNIKTSPLNYTMDIKFNGKPSGDNIIKCKKIIILPSDKQQQVLLNWFEAYRKMYNETLNIIKQLILENNKNMFNFRYIRTNKMKEYKQLLSDRTKINSHFLDGAIKLACSSYKSARTNFKNGNIKCFKIRPIKQAKKSKIMDIEKCYFYKDGFCKNSLGKMLTKEDFNYNEIDSDCKLHYNYKLNRFTLLVPVKTECNKNSNNDFISIDPGLKTFLTGISSNKIYKIGDNLTETVKNNLTKIDKLTKINNKKSRKRIVSIKSKNYNKITDLHWKTINYLIVNEKLKDILIGNWSTKEISSNERYLDTMSKRVANSLRFYEFIQKLKFKCKEYNINLKLVDESYTSKICSFCKEMTTIKNNRQLNCSCNLSLDRDINGCVNILLKSLN